VSTYRLQVIGDVPEGWTRDDVLATAASTATAEHEVDRCEVRRLSRHGRLVRVVVLVRADSDVDASVLGVRIQRAIPSATDLIVDRREQKYVRVSRGRMTH
jgi:hypothetical protein